MEFRVNYKQYTNAPSPAGTKEVPVYELELVKGIKVLKKTDKKKNIYDRIQAPLEETKITNILARAKAGDESVLHKTKSGYLDTTILPQTLAEYEELKIKGEQMFANEPIEIRSQYNYSILNYLQGLQNGEVEKLKGTTTPSTTTPSTSTTPSISTTPSTTTQGGNN